MNYVIERPVDKPPIPLALIVMTSIVVLFIGYNVYLAVSPQVAPLQVTNSTQLIGAILLSPADCTECFALKSLATAVFQTNFQEVSLADQNGTALAAKYSISKVPALIVFDTAKIQTIPELTNAFVQMQDAFVLESPSAPFVDVATGEVRGKVTVISISPLNCPLCTPSQDFLDEIKGNKVFLQEEALQEGTSQANAIVEKYSLTFLPAFVFSQDLLEYPQFKQAWNALGSVESDGFLVMREPLPPYKNLSTNATEGLVSITYITDNSCQTCYNVSIHQQAVKNYNLFVVNESYVDSASLEGQALIEKYNVTIVPTVIVSKEANVYFSLRQVWDGVGSVESDGALVFRKFSSIPGIVYRDLVSGSIISVPSAS